MSSFSRSLSPAMIEMVEGLHRRLGVAQFNTMPPQPEEATKSQRFLAVEHVLAEGLRNISPPRGPFDADSMQLLQGLEEFAREIPGVLAILIRQRWVSYLTDFLTRNKDGQQKIETALSFVPSPPTPHRDPVGYFRSALENAIDFQIGFGELSVNKAAEASRSNESLLNGLSTGLSVANYFSLAHIEVALSIKELMKYVGFKTDIHYMIAPQCFDYTPRATGGVLAPSADFAEYVKVAEFHPLPGTRIGCPATKVGLTRLLAEDISSAMKTYYVPAVSKYGVDFF